VALVM